MIEAIEAKCPTQLLFSVFLKDFEDFDIQVSFTGHEQWDVNRRVNNDLQAGKTVVWLWVEATDHVTTGLEVFIVVLTCTKSPVVTF